MKESTVNKYIQKYLDHAGRNIITATDIRITCVDGCSFMVGVGTSRFSLPSNANANFHYEFEIRDHNFNNAAMEKLTDYVTNKIINGNRVYAYVPFYIVDNLIESHGGIHK